MSAIDEYGPVIHEFDPYFNYRATEVRKQERNDAKRSIIKENEIFIGKQYRIFPHVHAFFFPSILLLSSVPL
jgi:hypothetical protein